MFFDIFANMIADDDDDWVIYLYDWNHYCKLPTKQIVIILLPVITDPLLKYISNNLLCYVLKNIFYFEVAT